MLSIKHELSVFINSSHCLPFALFEVSQVSVIIWIRMIFFLQDILPSHSSLIIPGILCCLPAGAASTPPLPSNVIDSLKRKSCLAAHFIYNSGTISSRQNQVRKSRDPSEVTTHRRQTPVAGRIWFWSKPPSRQIHEFRSSSCDRSTAPSDEAIKEELGSGLLVMLRIYYDSSSVKSAVIGR